MPERSRQEVERRVMFLLRQLSAEMQMLSEAHARIVKLNRTDLRALEIMARQGPLSAGELAQRLHLTTGAVTGILDRLEHEGHTHRVRNPSDRRQVVVEQTPHAHQVARNMVLPMVERLHKELRSFSKADLELAARFIETVKRAIAEHTTEAFEEHPGEPRA
jgi:DNA-binding MarR family transcriptional regulator